MARIGYRSALIVVASAAVLIAAAPPAAAVADTPPQLVSIALSRESIAVSGTDVQLLTVSVHLTDDNGVVDAPSMWDPYPIVRFGNTGVTVYLQLGSGTERDGVWTGVAPVTSDWGASEQPTQVAAYDTAYNYLYVDPRTVIDTPAVRVQSSNQPVLTITMTPDPVLPGTAVTRTVRAVNKTTGQPWPRLPLVLAAVDGCGHDTVSAANARTDADGVVRGTYPAGIIWESNECAWVPAANVPGQFGTRIGYVNAKARYQYLVSAKPAATAVPAGTNVEVTGSVTPAVEGKTVNLQRLTGTTWRTVSTAVTRASSRYTLVATPSGTVAWTYRVQVADGERRVGNTSPTFTIRGTP